MRPTSVTLKVKHSNWNRFYNDDTAWVQMLTSSLLISVTSGKLLKLFEFLHL